MRLHLSLLLVQVDVHAVTFGWCHHLPVGLHDLREVALGNAGGDGIEDGTPRLEVGRQGLRFQPTAAFGYPANIIKPLADSPGGDVIFGLDLLATGLNGEHHVAQALRGRIAALVALRLRAVRPTHG